MSSLLERGIKVLELLAGHPEGLALSAIATRATCRSAPPIGC